MVADLSSDYSRSNLPSGFESIQIRKTCCFSVSSKSKRAGHSLLHTCCCNYIPNADALIYFTKAFTVASCCAKIVTFPLCPATQAFLYYYHYYYCRYYHDMSMPPGALIKMKTLTCLCIIAFEK